MAATTDPHAADDAEEAIEAATADPKDAADAEEAIVAAAADPNDALPLSVPPPGSPATTEPQALMANASSAV